MGFWGNLFNHFNREVKKRERIRKNLIDFKSPFKMYENDFEPNRVSVPYPDNGLDDHESWENYYRHYLRLNPGADELYGRPNVVELIRTLLHAHKTNSKSVWCPGCGLSLLPRLLAFYGMEVIATDISTTAIEAQKRFVKYPLVKRCPKTIKYVQEECGAKIDPDKYKSENNHPIFLTHDFRESFENHTFDLVYNELAFQGLSDLNMVKTAESHYNALNPGGYARFVTLNIAANQLRDKYEKIISNAGFYIPSRKSTLWLREQTEKTNIEYRQANQLPPREKTKAIKAIDEEYKRIIDEYNKKYADNNIVDEKVINDGKSKIAHIIYGSG